MSEPEQCLACPPELRCICDPDNLFDPPNPTPVAVEGCRAHSVRRTVQQDIRRTQLDEQAAEIARADV